MFHKLSFFLSRIWYHGCAATLRKPLPPAGLRDVAASRIPFTPVIRPKLAEGPTTLAATIDDGDRSGTTRCLSLYPEAFFFWRFVCVCVCVCWDGLVYVKYHLVVHDFKLKPQAF